MITRRGVLIAGAGAVGVGAAGTVGWQRGPYSAKLRLGLTPDPYMPRAAEGQVRLERVRSGAMGGDVDLFTAVPAGFRDGASLPVVVVLHGSSASAAAFRRFGLARFLTAVVERGTPPFVLAGTDDGPAGWVPDGSGPDPQQMLRHDLPRWLAQRGHDAGRLALWGWSRGGYGALRLAEATAPGFAVAAALFSPALVTGDQVFDGRPALSDLPLGFWCGTSDPFYDAVRSFVDGLPTRPEVVGYSEGAHTRVFWNDQTLQAFDWLGQRLSGTTS